MAEQIFVCGLDEAGRGPLAGPVTAAAVVLNPNQRIASLDDSKKLTEKKREALYDLILNSALAYSIVSFGPREIEKRNIRQASLDAMKRSAEEVTEKLEIPPLNLFCMIDGNAEMGGVSPQEAVVKGDAKIRAISAASILAKVWRDREMKRLAKQFPQYGFEKHKGYPTKFHREMIAQHGPSPEHRRTFAGVKEYL